MLHFRTILQCLVRCTSGYDCTAFCYDETLQQCQLGRKGPVIKTSMYANNQTCYEWPGKSVLVCGILQFASLVWNCFENILIYWQMHSYFIALSCKLVRWYLTSRTSSSILLVVKIVWRQRLFNGDFVEKNAFVFKTYKISDVALPSIGLGLPLVPRVGPF